MAGKGFPVIARSHANVDQQRAFDAVLPIDLPQVFTGHGPLPGIESVEHFDGGWDAAGQSRKINLRDGNSAIEHLHTFESPERFAYRLDSFTGPLGGLVDHCDGEWSFVPDGDGTRIQWSFTWHPKWYGAPVVWIVSLLWKQYADRIAVRCAQVAEQAA